MQRERHERLGEHSAAVITVAKSHGVSVDELMQSLGELVDSGEDFAPEHDGHHAAVAAAAKIPALTRITWPKRPAPHALVAAEQQKKWLAENAERVKKKLAARELERKRKAEAAELAQAELEATRRQTSTEPEPEPTAAPKRSRRKTKRKS